ncbi:MULTISPECIES: ribosome small subunit-dependent GTPase A [unclassified Ruminococcus]|uniref:ribosome small subunit-dependent GTPase A n=1 Tax=unclassified Ruminococcus TaxID=2608920 RepID=UPI00210D65BC|nr:ribosome small subunit-dependent GTPase A [Ruminococcus sp. zg-924]MCQ4114826.1 ribosome small subunit-dependent GTPase A [Ruminococcus sp. zg-921]
MITEKGIITKLIGGFYYVEAAEKIYECKARGAFRLKGNAPCVGDYVEIGVPNDGYCVIEKVLPRKNRLVRPALANIDRLVIVSSVISPTPNTLIIDKMIATAVKKGIEPMLVISKTDLCSPDELFRIYSNSGINTLCFSSKDYNTGELKSRILAKGITAFTGNSGVGKSTLLNAMLPETAAETGDISKKLGRGRHTTRTVELHKNEMGYVADTPGFSTVDLQRYEIIKKDELVHCFSEFEPYLDDCRFTSCSHTKELGCAVLEAIKNGKIEKSRHQSYVAMYNEVKDLKEWEMK